MSGSIVFIDGAYLEKAIESTFGTKKIDFAKLANGVVPEDDHLIRAYYYHCLPFRSKEPTEKEEERYSAKAGFFSAIKYLPRFELRLGRLIYRGNDSDGRPIFTQKGIEVLLATDMVKYAAFGSADRQILIASNNDYIPIVEAIKDLGVVAHVVTFDSKGNGTSRLASIADEHTSITDIDPFTL